MTNVYDLLNRLNGVKKGQGEQWIARCPAHDDKNASLSVANGDKGIVLHCHAGCTTEQITAALGISCRDLFYEEKGGREVDPIVATYKYYDDNGVLLAEKLRKASKKFTWRKPKGSGWEYSRKGVPYVLYTGGKPLDIQTIHFYNSHFFHHLIFLQVELFSPFRFVICLDYRSEYDQYNDF